MNDPDKLTGWQKLNMQLSMPTAILISTILICTTALIYGRYELQTYGVKSWVMNRVTGKLFFCDPGAGNKIRCTTEKVGIAQLTD
jgi:hypothetical protein